jgi:hypothetical protein
MPRWVLVAAAAVLAARAASAPEHPASGDPPIS